ncbi:hypothetical protein HDV00_004729 [Rhizophlyctis rosea]|nr:hypothetical protein HDV00_004729 [Rhizophlyctis rosea]
MAFVHVACAPGSGRTCPLSHPLVHTLKTDFWDARVEPTARKAQAFAQSHIVPTLKKQSANLDAHVIKPHILPHYERTVAPHVKSACTKLKAMQKSKEWVALHDAYFHPYSTRIQREWHDAAVFFVDKAVPDVLLFTKTSGMWVKSRGIPLVRSEVAKVAVALRAFWDRYYPEVVRRTVEAIRTLRESDLVTKATHSAAVENLKKSYEEHLAGTITPALLVVSDISNHVQAHSRKLFVVWARGFDFVWRGLEDRISHEEWAEFRKGVHETIIVLAEGVQLGVHKSLVLLERSTGWDLRAARKANNETLTFIRGNIGRLGKEGSKAATLQAKKATESIKTATATGKKTASSVTSSVSSKAASVQSTISTKAKAVTSEVKEAATDIGRSVSSQASAAVSNASKSVSVIGSSVSSKANSATQAGKSSVASAGSSVSAAVSSATQVGKESVASGKSSVSTKVASATDVGKESVTSAQSSIATKMSGVKELGKSKVDSVMSSSSSMTQSSEAPVPVVARDEL